MTLRVAIADDHPLFLDGLRLLLETTPDLEVVVTAPDGEQLLQQLEGVNVDVVVVDLDMPGVDGADAARRLVALRPGLPVLVLTMHDDGGSAVRALRAGARGYVLKGAGHGAIVRAVRAVADGDTVLGGIVGHAVVEAATTGPVRHSFPGLTDREHEVLELVARGRDNTAIANRLFLSVKTVQNHVSNLLTKLDAGSRGELVARARDGGLGA
jgi:DNA-binding NarL/FixJ family response regulator